MKTLLLNLLSLHLVFMGSEVYGALPQSVRKNAVATFSFDA